MGSTLSPVPGGREARDKAAPCVEGGGGGLSPRSTACRTPRPRPRAGVRGSPARPRDSPAPTHQLLRPHVVQDPLGVLAVVPALHDGQQQLGGVVLKREEGGGGRESCWSGGRNAPQPMGQPGAGAAQTARGRTDEGPARAPGQVCGAGSGPERQMFACAHLPTIQKWGTSTGCCGGARGDGGQEDSRRGCWL